MTPERDQPFPLTPELKVAPPPPPARPQVVEVTAPTRDRRLRLLERWVPATWTPEAGGDDGEGARSPGPRCYRMAVTVEVGSVSRVFFFFMSGE